MAEDAARPGEFDLIARYLRPLADDPAALNLTDDAAAFVPPPGQSLVLTKDMVAAGIHFFPDDPAVSIARKALRVNLSDLAAKGARPLGYLLGLALPADWTPGWMADFAAGLAGELLQAVVERRADSTATEPGEHGDRSPAFRRTGRQGQIASGDDAAVDLGDEPDHRPRLVLPVRQQFGGGHDLAGVAALLRLDGVAHSGETDEVRRVRRVDAIRDDERLDGEAGEHGGVICR